MDKLIQWLDKWFQSSGLYSWWQSKVAPADEPEGSTRTHIEQFAADTYPRLFNEFFGKRYDDVGDIGWTMDADKIRSFL